MKWTKPLPDKLPTRIHFDSGHDHTSWTGELRAVVDGEQLVIRRWSPSKGWVYFIEWRYGWEQGWIRRGPLPKRRRAEIDLQRGSTPPRPPPA